MRSFRAIALATTFLSASLLARADDALGTASEDEVDPNVAESIALSQLEPEWQVTPNGALSYSVPIDIPPGRHGMQPKLSLVYNSSAGNGLAGMGWSLAGLPGIARVNVGQGINYLGTGEELGWDSLAVDPAGWGTPLDPSTLLIPIGDTSYHTQLESWRSYTPDAGLCGVGPCSWTMLDGKGNTYHFAFPLWERNNGDVSHRGVAAWLLSKVVDVHGNGWTVTWTASADGSAAMPSRIVYTTHETQTVATYTIDFSYEARPDRSPPPFFFDQRLSAITVWSTNQAIRRYAIHYTDGAAHESGKSLIDSIQTLGSDLSPATAPPPLRFVYDDAPTQRTVSPTTIEPMDPNDAIHSYLTGDFLGNGTQQILGFRMTHVDVGDGGAHDYLRVGHIQTFHTSDNAQHRWQAVAGDVDGDGRDDVAVVELGPGSVQTYLARGGASDGLVNPPVAGSSAVWGDSGSDSATYGQNCWWCGVQVLKLDLNDDGRMDLAFYEASTDALAYTLGTPNGFGPINVVSNKGKATGGWCPAYAADVNGDGYADLICGDLNGTVYYLGSPSGFQNPYTISAPTSVPKVSSALSWSPVITDVNGDRRADLVYANTVSSTAIAYGHSSPWFGLSTPVNGGGLTDLNTDTWFLTARTGDVNGDGIGDVLLTNVAQFIPTILDYTSVLLGNPNGKQTYWTESFTSTMVYVVADVTNVGRTDVISLDTNSVGTTVLRSRWVGGTTGMASPQLFATVPGWYPAGPVGFLLADEDGTGAPDMILYDAAAKDGSAWRIHSAQPDRKADLLIGIDNGIGGTLTAKYQRAASLPSAIQPGATCGPGCSGIPNRQPRYLVTSATVEDGRQHARTTSYNYVNGMRQLGGRFVDHDLGFAHVDSIDADVGTITATDYRQDSPFDHRVINHTVTAAGSQKPASTDVTVWQKNSPYARIWNVVPSSVTHREYEAGNLVRTKTRTLGYGSFGTLTQESVCDVGTSSSVCSNWRRSYNSLPIATIWQIGQLYHTVHSVGDGSATSGNELRLDEESVGYDKNGYDVISRQRLLCDDATACLCPIGGDCTGTGKPGRWVSVESGHQYDVFGNLTRVADANGHAKLTNWDPASGQPSQVGQSVFHGGVFSMIRTSRTYDFAGRLATETDPNNAVTTTSYDNMGRKAKVVHPSGEIDTWVYNNVGNATTQYVRSIRAASAGGPQLSTDRFFDGNGFVYLVQQPDDSGQVCSTRERFVGGTPTHLTVEVSPPHACGTTVPFLHVDHDGLGRPQNSYRYDGTTHTLLRGYVYSPGQTFITDAKGNRVVQTFDARNRMIAHNDATGTTTYQYDGADRLVTTSRPGSVLTNAYDTFGRKRSESDPWSGVTRTTYDDVGNRISRVDALGKTSTWTYDELNRMTSLTDTQGKTTWQYDGAQNAIGRLWRVDDPSGNTVLTYDASGNVISRATQIFGLSPTVTNYGFDPLGRLISKKFALGVQLTYVYSPAGHLSGIDNGNLRLVTLDSYSPFGKPQRIRVEKSELDRVYQSDGLIHVIRGVAPDGTVLQSDIYAYDPLDNVQGITDMRASKLVQNIDTDHTQTFGYDTTSRLATASGKYGPRQYHYATTDDLVVKDGMSLAYTNLPNGREIVGTAGTTKALDEIFDATGNLVSKTDSTNVPWTLTWDDQRRLISVMRGSSLMLHAVYDYTGRRVKKVEPVAGNQVTTYYFDGCELRTIGSMSARTTYIDAPGAGVVAELRGGSLPGDVLGPGTFIHHTNHLGSPTVVTGTDGKPVAHYTYDPYGQVDPAHTFHAGAVASGFNGKTLDASGLTYVGARYYDPAVGRFLSADSRIPRGEHAVRGLNRYAYAFDNPVKYTDPTGHSPLGGGWLSNMSDLLPAYLTLSSNFGAKGDFITLSRDAILYGGDIQTTSVGSIGGSMTLGWIMERKGGDWVRTINPVSIDDFNQGRAFSFSWCKYVCFQVTMSGDRFAVEEGLGDSLSLPWTNFALNWSNQTSRLVLGAPPPEGSTANQELIGALKPGWRDPPVVSAWDGMDAGAAYGDAAAAAAIGDDLAMPYLDEDGAWAGAAAGYLDGLAGAGAEMPPLIPPIEIPPIE